jgi:hypothetical protein
MHAAFVFAQPSLIFDIGHVVGELRMQDCSQSEQLRVSWAPAEDASNARRPVANPSLCNMINSF